MRNQGSILIVLVATSVLGCSSAKTTIAVDKKDDNEENPPPDYRKAEKLPQPVRNVQPQYPVEALRAGIEGTVYVKLWVDKSGNVREAKILKSDNELFNQSAVEAGLQWRFTPAIIGNEPVSVWVIVPMKFRVTKKN